MPPPWAPAWGARSMIATAVANYRTKGWAVTEHPSGLVWACPPVPTPPPPPAPVVIPHAVPVPPSVIATEEGEVESEVEGIF